MAFNLKQIVSLGLVLGVLTAFGYHFITRPDDRVAIASPSKSLRPIESFDLEPVELPKSTLVPTNELKETNEFDSVPAQPQADRLSLNDQMVKPMAPQAVAPESVTDNTSEFDLGALSLEPVAEEKLESTLEPEDLESSEASLAEANAVIDQLQLESPLESPMAPLEMQTANNNQPAAPANDEMESEFPSTPALPVVQKGLATQDQNDSEKAEPGGWKSNPFIKNQTAQPTTMQAGHTQNSIAQVKTLEELTAESYQAAPVSPNTTNEPVRDFSANLSEPIQRPGNSVVSLIDPDREAMAPISEEVPARDYGMQPEPEYQAPTPVAQAVPLTDADAQQAVHHIEYGKKLSRRGAGFTAREEFLKAIQVLASANDRATGGNDYTQALRRATMIINEAEDFAVGSAEQQIQMDLANVVDSHRSNVLTPQEAGRLTADQAIDRYFAKAQQLLDLAGGRSPVSAEVFYCMGKLNSALPAKQNVQGPLEMAKSVVFHQAALMSNPNHHRSANELGVLFAKNGRLQQAKLLFERSLMAKPHPQTWRNLATTHRRLGEHEYARRAENERNLLAQRPIDDTTIAWIGVEQFNSTTETPVAVRTAALPEDGKAAAADQLTPNSEQKKSLGQKLKDLF